MIKAALYFRLIQRIPCIMIFRQCQEEGILQVLWHTVPDCLHLIHTPWQIVDVDMIDAFFFILCTIYRKNIQHDCLRLLMLQRLFDIIIGNPERLFIGAEIIRCYSIFRK